MIKILHKYRSPIVNNFFLTTKGYFLFDKNKLKRITHIEKKNKSLNLVTRKALFVVKTPKLASAIQIRT